MIVNVPDANLDFFVKLMIMIYPSGYMPLVSVLIPNYNHAKYLPARIESVLSQSYKNIEIIILDDYSPDDSIKVIDKYAAMDSRIRVLYNKQNSGSTFKQWNKGFALVKGEYVWIAESDDVAALDFLEILVEQLEADKKTVLAYSDSFVIDSDDKVQGTCTWYLTELDTMWQHDFVADGLTLVRKYMSYRNIIPNASAVVMRNSFLQEVMPVDDNYRLFGDIMFWAKLLSRGKVAYVAQPLNYFRTHQNNVRTKTQTDGTGLEENSKVLRMMSIYGPADPTYRAAALDDLLNLWYRTWIQYGLSWKQHRNIYNNIIAEEPSIAPKVMAVFGRNFFYNMHGFRVLLGDRFLYKFWKRKGA